MGTTALEAKLLHQLMVIIEAFLYEVFLDLHKAYSALEWDIRLEIIATYRLVPRVIWILWTYWGNITIVDMEGGYYGPPLKGYQVVTRGDPCPPCSSTWLWIPSSYTRCQW